MQPIDYLPCRNVCAILQVPGVGIVTVRTAQQTTRNEQHNAKARPVVTGRSLVGVNIPKRSIGVVECSALIRGIRRDANAKIVAAAEL